MLQSWFLVRLKRFEHVLYSTSRYIRTASGSFFKPSEQCIESPPPPSKRSGSDDIGAPIVLSTYLFSFSAFTDP